MADKIIILWETEQTIKQNYYSTIRLKIKWNNDQSPAFPTLLIIDYFTSSW